MEGCVDGTPEGWDVGCVGSDDGCVEGCVLGIADGCEEGCIEGDAMG